MHWARRAILSSSPLQHLLHQRRIVLQRLCGLVLGLLLVLHVGPTAGEVGPVQLPRQRDHAVILAFSRVEDRPRGCTRLASVRRKRVVAVVPQRQRHSAAVVVADLRRGDGVSVLDGRPSRLLSFRVDVEEDTAGANSL